MSHAFFVFSNFFNTNRNKSILKLIFGTKLTKEELFVYLGMALMNTLLVTQSLLSLIKNTHHQITEIFTFLARLDLERGDSKEHQEKHRGANREQQTL